MNLLYCANGLVLGWHDDAAPPVPLASYGSGVRIIPYDQPIGSLSRVGPPPPDKYPLADPRPYGQPTETPVLLKAYASQVRYNVTTAGVVEPISAQTIYTDRMSQMLIGNLAIYAKTLAPTAAIDFTQANQHIAMTAQQVINLDTQISQLVQQCRSIEAQCFTDIDAATLATYDDVDARFAGV
ncbi:MAG TPA: hypothetical protein VGH47_04390 [Xanthobacteraceae bacterium]|jgi:hypothetical protein